MTDTLTAPATEGPDRKESLPDLPVVPIGTEALVAPNQQGWFKPRADRELTFESPPGSLPQNSALQGVIGGPLSMPHKSYKMQNLIFARDDISLTLEDDDSGACTFAHTHTKLPLR